MATSRKDDLIAWLRDARAMEAATTGNLGRAVRLAGRLEPLAFSYCSLIRFAIGGLVLVVGEARYENISISNRGAPPHPSYCGRANGRAQSPSPSLSRVDYGCDGYPARRRHRKRGCGAY
jgi:hypothetical protein